MPCYATLRDASLHLELICFRVASCRVASPSLTSPHPITSGAAEGAILERQVEGGPPRVQQSATVANSRVRPGGVASCSQTELKTGGLHDALRKLCVDGMA